MHALEELTKMRYYMRYERQDKISRIKNKNDNAKSEKLEPTFLFVIFIFNILIFNL